MTSDTKRQRVFRRMLAQEAGTDADAPAIAAAARHVCERFAERLSPLIGDAGMAAICDRSRHLAERNARGIESTDASPHEDSQFVLLQRFLEQQEPAAALESAVAVLDTSSELLTSFIGEALTTSLLREVWPEDFGGDTTEDAVT